MGISFKGVSHKYRGLRRKDITVALDNINLTIDEKDEFIFVIGRTGSGKSTLISHMNGLLLPTEGEIDICGYHLTRKVRKNPKLKPVRKKIGFVFQFPEYQLFEENVYKDIIFAPTNFGFKKEEIEESLNDVCKILNIPEALLKKSPFNLSGGQMRKVAIAGVLAYKPDILILDEPTRGLDPQSAEEIMEIFYKIHKDFHKTIIAISHDMDLVYKYATRCVVMKNAKVCYDGTAKELFSTDIYKEYHLRKPEILSVIDRINENTNANLSYDIHSSDELILKLKEAIL